MTNKRQQPSSTSSRTTAVLPRFEQVLALGRRLVDQLDLESSADTLGRWMAHHIAELIDAAENAPAEERAAAQKSCFDAILELWNHRAELPDGERPFEDLEPVMRAIGSLDPENETPRYFRTVRERIFEEDEEPKTQSLLEVVRDLDSTAKMLIGHTLADAARSAVDKSKEWVALAEDAGTKLGGYETIIRFIESKAYPGNELDPNEDERELLQNRMRRLEAFVETAERVINDLRTRIEELQPAQGQSESGPV